MEVEALRHGGSKVVGELQSAVAADIDVLLNSIPLDVINARGDLEAVREVVLRSDLEALRRVGAIGLRGLAVRKPVGDQARTACGDQRRIIAARPESLGVGEVIEIVFISLEIETKLRRERGLMLRATCIARSVVFVAVRKMRQRKAQIGVPAAGRQRQLVGQL